MQRHLPFYRPWPLLIAFHRSLVFSVPQLYPRRASNPLTTQVGPLKTRRQMPQERASSNRLSVVTPMSHATPRRSESQAETPRWIRTKIGYGLNSPVFVRSLILAFVLDLPPFTRLPFPL